uniref:Uncharacterized protein n=1 Tax=Timema monikensis TaxID=170555 RepID=A0A7R9EJ09_9NEOP|nr:unnamed protein product [Timema monikensis]
MIGESWRYTFLKLFLLCIMIQAPCHLLVTVILLTTDFSHSAPQSAELFMGSSTNNFTGDLTTYVKSISNFTASEVSKMAENMLINMTQDYNISSASMNTIIETIRDKGTMIIEQVSQMLYTIIGLVSTVFFSKVRAHYQLLKQINFYIWKNKLIIYFWNLIARIIPWAASSLGR